MGRRSKKDSDSVALKALEELITGLQTLVKQSTNALANRVGKMEKRVEDFENDIADIIEAVASFKGLSLGTSPRRSSSPSSPSAPSVGSSPTTAAPVTTSASIGETATPTPGKQKTVNLDKPGAPKL